MAHAVPSRMPGADVSHVSARSMLVMHSGRSGAVLRGLSVSWHVGVSRQLDLFLSVFNAPRPVPRALPPTYPPLGVPPPCAPSSTPCPAPYPHAMTPHLAAMASADAGMARAMPA